MPLPAPLPTVDPTPRGPKVHFATPERDAVVGVEVVATPAKIQRGLMYRQHLPPDDGMLFVMDEEKDWTFWMHNTLIPLDMIYLGDDRRVVGVVANAEPSTDTQRTVGKPSRYVVEVGGGEAAAHAVGPGTRAVFVAVDE